ncbi:hypothetical protein OG896_21945 [Streptomyces sp. NBC_00669]|uniref:hypothetical protein n=1 Tax=Streptomyces sp. NBC_00669 TaxID=2976011 RepID=UPI002E361153|nr:hypothetical protein [Streptomyces sp. NBC_00669]
MSTAPAGIHHAHPPIVCRSTTLLPLSTLAAAVRMTADSSAVDKAVQCCLHHKTGTHYGLVAEIDPTHAVWAVWRRDGNPHLRVLADCPETSPDRMDGCALYVRHRGAHTWQTSSTSHSPPRSAMTVPPR